MLKTLSALFIYFSILKESFLLAWHALKVNKLRTFLSLLGVTIGIFCIVSVLTIVDSLEKNIQQSISELGNDVIFIQKWPWEFGGEYPWWKYFKRPLPSVKEYEFLAEKSSLAHAIAFSASSDLTLTRNEYVAENIQVEGITQDYASIFPLYFHEGRYFTQNETEGGHDVAIIGWNVFHGLFPDETSPMGKKIKIQHKNYTVIGVLSKQGESLINFNNHDNRVYVPLNNLRSLTDIESDNANPIIFVRRKTTTTNENLKQEIKILMRIYRKLKPAEEDNFSLNETTLLAIGFEGLFKIIHLAGSIIGGFAILIGAFGIANIMYVSVKERTPQIGIQKALGARNSFILMQFLFESIVLCLFGGLTGILIVFLLLLVVQYGFEMEIFMSKGVFATGIALSIATGLLSGYFPARSASLLNPIEAIRG